MVRKPVRRLLVGVVTGALVLAACGGGGDAADNGGASPQALDPVAPSTSASPSPTPVDPAAPRSPSGEPVTLAFGGDVHFEGAVASRLAADPASTFGPVAAVLSAADVAVVNLETAITEGGDPAPKEYTFRAPPTAFAALQGAGVDVATLANNHGMDYGVEGLQDTLASARQAGFPLVGAGLDADAAYAPWRTTVRGQRIAVFGATQVLDGFAVDSWRAGPSKPGLASAKDDAEAALLAAVSAERPQADTVVVDLHWGQERSSCPLPRQEELARQLAGAGADVVVGSHAHVLLGGGWLADGPGAGAYVDYGLGNFVFYARPGPGADSGVLQLTVQGRAVTAATWVPAIISGGTPRPAEGSSASRILGVKDGLRERCTALAAAPPPPG